MVERSTSRKRSHVGPPMSAMEAARIHGLTLPVFSSWMNAHRPAVNDPKSLTIANVELTALSS